MGLLGSATIVWWTACKLVPQRQKHIKVGPFWVEGASGEEESRHRIHWALVRGRRLTSDVSTQHYGFLDQRMTEKKGAAAVE